MKGEKDANQGWEGRNEQAVIVKKLGGGQVTMKGDREGQYGAGTGKEMKKRREAKEMQIQWKDKQKELTKKRKKGHKKRKEMIWP